MQTEPACSGASRGQSLEGLRGQDPHLLPFPPVWLPLLTRSSNEAAVLASKGAKACMWALDPEGQESAVVWEASSPPSTVTSITQKAKTCPSCPNLLNHRHQESSTGGAWQFLGIGKGGPEEETFREVGLYDIHHSTGVRTDWRSRERRWQEKC